MPFSNPFRRTKKDKSQASTETSESFNSSSLDKTSLINGNFSTPSADCSNQYLLFHAQLAHGSPTVQVGDFSSVRELYEKIANAFSISFDEIIFCTLNTHKCDMDRLLGGQIGLEDFIFAHIKGRTKHVTLTKIEPSLGLTITDNGTGYPFVKRLKENSVAARDGTIFVGDLIEAINQQSTIGCRHFHVAQMLKEMEVGSTFTITLVEPQKAFDMISQRGVGKAVLSGENVGGGKSTLRLRSKGRATIEAVPTEKEGKAMTRIDDLLDSFLGIRDMELASTILDCGKDKQNSDEFLTALDEQLGDFGFPEEFTFDVWGIILDSRNLNA